MTKHNSKVANLWNTTVLILAVLVPFSLMAQQPTGKILGTVTDPAGAVVPGATVTVTNTATRVSSQTQTDKDGNFQVLALPIGNYQVAAEREGFAKSLAEARTLEINQSVRMDIKLKLGSRTETITVESRASGVETVNPTLGQSITVNSLVGLPLNVRNPYDLALLLPGVTEANPNSGSTQQSTVGNFSVAGGRPDSVTFLLDGGVNNNLLNNGVVFSPNPDTLGEFRVLTSNYTAEYGRNGAGVISAVTKSGTNTLHGSVFEFLRNDIFNANSYFNNRNNIPKEILKRNQFGFTVGGPVTIPHVVDGRDKLFFFASYAG
ncbi:MAG TPA: carboxypeptidase regulatory-like domain-containing protein, partial [Candidatus Angelobacter sp.]